MKSQFFSKLEALLLLAVPAFLAALLAGCVSPSAAPEGGGSPQGVRAPALSMTRPLNITTTNQTPVYYGLGPVGTNNFLELWQAGPALKFAVPSNGILPIVYGGTGTNTPAGVKSRLGIDSGTLTNSSDGTVTQAFSFTYASAPVVLLNQQGENTTPTNVLSVTTTQFILRTSKFPQTNKWIAVGAP